MKKKGNLLLCASLSLGLCGCNASKTHTLTFVNGDIRTSVSVEEGKTLGELQAIESKTGYDAYWTIDGEKISEGSVFAYSQDKEAILVYSPHVWKIVFDNENHTKLKVTYDQPIGELPSLPKKTGYDSKAWSIEGTPISSSTLYTWDKDSFASPSFEKTSYVLNFEGLEGSYSIKTYFDEAIGELPSVPAYSGDLSDHYSGYWTIDGIRIDEDYVWNFEESKTAKIVYKAFESDIEEGEKITPMSDSLRKLFSLRNDEEEFLECASNLLTSEEKQAGFSYKLTWSEVKPFQYSLLRISKDKDLSNATTYLTYNHYVNLTDLETNSTYYYQIEGFEGEKSIKSDVYSFVMKEGARILDVDGVENWRDLGAYKTTFEGKAIKQGMIYRSANADSVTALGKKQAKELYGVKTELDLREESYWKDESYFGEGVSYKHVSNAQGGVYYVSRGTEGDKTGLASGGATFKEELLVFAEPSNYPINFHCAIGRDRTGTLAAILLGLLGVSESDIYFDYVLSAISGKAKANDSDHLKELYDNIHATVEYIKNATGKTNFAEAVSSYLTTNFTGGNANANVNLSEGQVAAIKNAMLEDK